MYRQGHVVVVVSWMLLLLMLMTTSTWGLKCTQTGWCSCKTENGVIDLSPLASNTTARFNDVPGPASQAPWVYSWNPCTPLHEGNTSCDGVAVCVHNPQTQEYINIGNADGSVRFFTDPTSGNLSIEYMFFCCDGVVRLSSINLVCDPQEEAKLDVYGKTGMGYWSFQLTSKYACES